MIPRTSAIPLSSASVELPVFNFCSIKKLRITPFRRHHCAGMTLIIPMYPVCSFYTQMNNT